MPDQKKRPGRRLRSPEKPDAKSLPVLGSSRAIADRGSQNLQELGRMLEHTLAAIERVYGPNHPHFARALENHAASLRRMAEAAQARAQHIRNALLLRRGVWPGESRSPVLQPSPRSRPVPPLSAPTPPSGAPALLGVREASDYLTISADTLYGLVRGDEIAHTRVGRSIRFRMADLDRYLDERTSRTWTRVDRRGRPRKP